MDPTTAVVLAVALFLGVLVPFLVVEMRRGKAKGHTWFTWWKPRGHSDIGPDFGFTPTRPGRDDGRGGRR